jgi:CRP-like cAMP-binding protein
MSNRLIIELHPEGDPKDVRRFVSLMPGRAWSEGDEAQAPGHAARGTSGAVITKKELRILVELNKSRARDGTPIPLIQVDLSHRLGKGLRPRTLSRIIPRLRKEGFISCPAGVRNGCAITDRGVAALPASRGKS